MMETPITFKNKKGRNLILDGDHIFKCYSYNGKEVSVHMLKAQGWDGMHFISIKQWKSIKPELTWLFTADLYDYYKLIIKP